MKTRYLFIFLASLILASLACNTTTPTPPPTQPQTQTLAVSTATMTSQDADTVRFQIVANKQPLYADDNYWKGVPFGCMSSMASVLFSSTDTYVSSQVGSATLIYAEIANNQNGMTSWVYWLLTAKHVYTNSQGVLNGKTTIYAGRDKTEHAIDPFDFYEVSGPKTGLDIGVVALIDQGNKFNILTPSFIPLGVEKIQTGNNLAIDGSSYFTFDFPGSSNYLPQYTKSQIIKNIRHENGVQIILSFLNDSSVTDSGSSGGPLCNQASQLVGVHTQNMPNDPYQSIVEANPDDIQVQILKAIQNSREKLKLLGYIY